MTPQTLTEVENLIQKRLLWKLGASGMGACRRIVNDAIVNLQARYSHPSQLTAFRIEEQRLKRLLQQLGE